VAGGYDLAHLQRIHRHLFGDVYDWAGEIRTVALAKSDMFALPQFRRLGPVRRSRSKALPTLRMSWPPQ